jgi:hypothetical protein
LVCAWVELPLDGATDADPNSKSSLSLLELVELVEPELRLERDAVAL